MNKYKFLKEHKGFKTVESFKSLRTNLMFCGDSVKVIAVTSCSPNDGKSYITKNIAISLAETNKKVLMIDADLRKSVMMGKIVIEEDVLGLSHLLSGQAEMEQVIVQNEDYPTLYNIFAGSFPPNPVELLDSNEFKELIQNARKCFDYILIDTPPLGSVIDSAIVSSVSDGVLLVIRAGKTKYRFAKGIKAQLEKTGCRILGAVLNGVDFEDKDKYYYRNYKEYNYSNSYGYYR